MSKKNGKPSNNHTAKEKAVTEEITTEERPVLADALMFADTVTFIKRTHGLPTDAAVKMVDLAVSFKMAALASNPFGQTIQVGNPVPETETETDKQEA